MRTPFYDLLHKEGVDEIAAKTGLSKYRLIDIRRGATSPRLTELALLADVYGVNLSEVVVELRAVRREWDPEGIKTAVGEMTLDQADAAQVLRKTLGWAL